MDKVEYEFPDEKGSKAKVAQNLAKEDSADDNDLGIELQIVDDTPAQDRGRKPMAEPPEDVTDDELSQYDEKVQKRLKKFTKGYHDERRAKEEAFRERQAAEEFARQMYEENRSLQRQLSEGSKIFIEQGKSSAQMELEQARKAYKEAYEAGDVDAVTDAQAKIVSATLRLDKAENLRPIEVQEKPEYSPAKRTSLDPLASSWHENNPWYGSKEKPEHTVMTATAFGVHASLAEQYGEKYVGTEDYYEKINSRMRTIFPEYFGSNEQDNEPEEDAKAPARANKPSTVVASASRSTASKKQVKLSASQVNIAKRLGVPIELYAKKVAEQMERS
jgi:hypothetical protein